MPVNRLSLKSCSTLMDAPCCHPLRHPLGTPSAKSDHDGASTPWNHPTQHLLGGSQAWRPRIALQMLHTQIGHCKVPLQGASHESLAKSLTRCYSGSSRLKPMPANERQTGHAGHQTAPFHKDVQWRTDIARVPGPETDVANSGLTP